MSVSKSHDLIVAEDGRIPAEQIAKLGLRSAAHRRAIEAENMTSVAYVGGSLRHLPDLTWEGFERGSELAKHDLSSS